MTDTVSESIMKGAMEISEFLVKSQFRDEKMSDIPSLPPKPPAPSMPQIPVQIGNLGSIPTGTQNLGINASIFAPMSPNLTVKEIHQHIRNQMRYKRYYSITTTVPQAPFIPLPINAQMETRPCHPSTSRIHTLTCGHTIAVSRSAEPCATNCATRVLPDPKTCINSPILPQYTPLVSRIRNSIQAAVNQYASTFTVTDTHLDAKAMVHVAVLKRVWAQQDQMLAGTMDLLGGEFTCKKCGTEGQRVSMPVYMLAEEPYFCIVVGREPIDMQIIEELERGVLQTPVVPTDIPPYGAFPGLGGYAGFQPRGGHIGLQPRGGYAGLQPRDGYAGPQPRGGYAGRGALRQGLTARFDGRFNRYPYPAHPNHANYSTRQNGRGMQVPLTPRAHGAGIGKFRSPPRGSANFMSPRQVAIVRFREAEKQNVLGRLRDENLVENVKGMGFSG